MRWRLLLAVGLALQVTAADAAAAIPAWTTYRHDAARSGIDPDSTSPLTPAQAWQTQPLDGEVYGEPLVYGSFVYVATENDSVYKLNAATGAIAWSRHLATPEPSSMAPCGDIAPSIGITGTPVIDPVANRIYAVGAVLASGAVRHELFAVNLSSGAPVAGFPIVVDAPFPAGGAAVNQLQRPGLALDRGRVLIGYGGNAGDCKTYWGWLVSAPVDGSTGLSSFQVDAGVGHHAGAIWGSGNAPTIDAAGDVFVATGNGFGNTSQNPEYGESVVKLNPSAVPLDFWTPVNWQTLDGTDADLGSSMPTLLPGGFVFESGKDHNGYLLNGAHLGHVAPPVLEIPGLCAGGSFGGSVYDAGTSTLYVACVGGLRALSLSSGSPPALGPKPGFSAPSPAFGPPMIAAGLVWVTNHSTAGTLYGLDLTSGATRSSFSIPENGSQINHFAIPSAGGGRLFVASGDQVTAYTIARGAPPSPTATSLASSANPIRAGSPLSLTATVAPPPDSGSVTFTDGGAPISGCSGIAVTVASAGRAVCHVVFAHTGRHNLTASYSGDAFYAPSASKMLAEIVQGSGGGRGSGNPPVTSHASLSPRRFTAKHGTKLRVTLSEAATVTVVITRLRHGHMVGHHCSAKAGRGRSCRVRVTVKRLRFQARVGRTTSRLSLRHLSPGHFTALVRATDQAGNRSPVIRIGFTVVRARR